MKKFILLSAVFFTLISCAKNKSENDGIIEINERVFAGQINEMYLNAGDYLGKKVKLQGLFLNQAGEDYDPFYAVFRYGPGGCCGTDGLIGFEVKWANDKKPSYPKNDSWVEAIGELKEYSNEYYKVLYIELASLNVLNKRGREYVLQ